MLTRNHGQLAIRWRYEQPAERLPGGEVIASLLYLAAHDAEGAVGQHATKVVRHLDGVLEPDQRSLGVGLVELPHLLVDGHQPAVAHGDHAARALEVEVVEPEAEEAAQQLAEAHLLRVRVRVRARARARVGVRDLTLAGRAPPPPRARVRLRPPRARPRSLRAAPRRARRPD